MRPQQLDDIVGQDHIVGAGRLLRRAIQADRLSSILLYGPPGTGKTSLARVIANTTKSQFESLNAVLSGVKDIREVIARAEERRNLYGTRTILFVDEVHRWNKAQQDALLPWVENGTVILVGATTENPFFEVNRALVSRSRIFQLQALTSTDLMQAAHRALSDTDKGYGKWKIEFEEGSLEHLVEVANGDARSLLNALELAIETSVERWPPQEGKTLQVSFQAAEESIQRKAILYDRDGDYHFDTISAFIKSIRGSDPDAALYWMAKMLRAGEDPAFIFRRMIISAGEDIGMADPQAIVVTQACAEAFDRIGFPEGYFQLAQAALYLATAPKSNSTLAFFDALKEVEREDAEVPSHLKDASRDGAAFGHGEGYQYPHAFREHWTAQQYLPSALIGKSFYSPSEIGYEGRIREEILRKREIQHAVILSGLDTRQESLTWSCGDRSREGWARRLESGRGTLLKENRDKLIEAAQLLRHHRVLIAGATDGLLVGESLRRCPEGLVSAVTCEPNVLEVLQYQCKDIEETERPLLALSDELIPEAQQIQTLFGCEHFERILAMEPFRRRKTTEPIHELFTRFALHAASILSPDGLLCLTVSVPGDGQRLSALLAKRETSSLIETSSEDATASTDRALSDAELSAFAAAETKFFEQADGMWKLSELLEALHRAYLEYETELLPQSEQRMPGKKELELWCNPKRSAWGKSIQAQLGEALLTRIKTTLEELFRSGPQLWRWQSTLISAKLRP